MPPSESVIGKGHRSSPAVSGTSDMVSVRSFYIPESIPTDFENWSTDTATRPVRRPLRWLMWLALVCVLSVGVPSGLAEWLSGGTSQQNLTVAWLSTRDAGRMVSVYKTETHSVVTMPANDYLVNVLAAEISPTAPMPALQAVAIVARTYVDRTIKLGPMAESQEARAKHANVTDNGEVDLPWWTSRDQSARYGMEFAEDKARLQEAVISTDGMVLQYSGKPILAFVFPRSPGKTRDASYVLGKVYPYLHSTPCPDDLAGATWSANASYADKDVAAKLGVPVQSVHWRALHVDGTDVAGYPISVTDGLHQWMAQDFVNRLGLRSADFRLSVSGKRVIVKTIGVGNGIGLSVHEAEAMASKKETVSQILTRFFPGTRLSNESI